MRFVAGNLSFHIAAVVAVVAVGDVNMFTAH